MLEGPTGCGKSLAVSGALASATQEGKPTLRVHDEADIGRVANAISSESDLLLIIDDLDGLSMSAQIGLIRLVLARGARCLVTASDLHGSPRFLLEDASDVAFAALTSLEDRQGDVGCLLGLFWSELNDVALSASEIMTVDALRELARGPWGRGGHDLRLVVQSLSDLLDLEGAMEAGHPGRLLGVADIRGAILDLLRAELDVSPRSESRAGRIYVEGETDSVLLGHAASVASSVWQAELLRGLEIVPAGLGREGGAKRVVARAIADLESGTDVVGLLDNDLDGRHQLENARRFGVPVLLIPAQFDPLALDASNERLEVEIEDVLPVELIGRFYADHPALNPESDIRRGNRRRIQVSGPDKADFARWVEVNATPQDLMPLVYVLCRLVEMFKLPLAPGVPTRDQLESQLGIE